MSIPQWISKTAEEAVEPKVTDDAKLPVNFQDKAYDQLLEMYSNGTLDEEASQIIEEVEFLRDVMNVAISNVKRKVLDKDVLKKEAKDAPVLDFSKSTENVPPAMPSGRLPKSLPQRLSPKLKDPETTKWKEIRFNKRTGTWQAVVTTRSVKNFTIENEAIDFIKKANITTNPIIS